MPNVVNRVKLGLACKQVDSHSEEWIVAKKNIREKIKLKSPESATVYWTTKNKRNTTGRLELKKYDKALRKHVMFKEAK